MRLTILLLCSALSSFTFGDDLWQGEPSISVVVSLPFGGGTTESPSLFLALNEESVEGTSNTDTQIVAGNIDQEPIAHHSGWNILIMAVGYQYGVRPLSNKMFGLKL